MTGLIFDIDGAEVEIKQLSDSAYYLALDEGLYSNHLQDIHKIYKERYLPGGGYRFFPFIDPGLIVFQLRLPFSFRTIIRRITE